MCEQPPPQKGEGLPSVRLSMCPFFPSGNFLQRFLSAPRADPALDAAKKAGVKRFVPCARITVCPTGGSMRIRNQKEEIHQHIRRLGLPYTIIDVGYWYQASFPTPLFGRVDTPACCFLIRRSWGMGT